MAWRGGGASAAWTLADNEAWTSLPSTRSGVLPWLAVAWLVVPPLLLNGDDCGDHLACTWLGDVLLVAWLTLVFALLRGNVWAAVAAPAVGAGFVLVAEQESLGVAALVLVTGWSLFEAAWAYRCLRGQRRFLAGRRVGRIVGLTEQDPGERLTAPG